MRSLVSRGNGVGDWLQPPLVGRRREIEHLSAEIREGASQLLSVVGPPGVGKTRLALEVATAFSSDVDRVAVFMSLDDLSHIAGLPAALALALGADGQAVTTDVTGALRHRIGGRDVLLVADGLDSPGWSMDRTAHLIASLLATCPTLIVVATSREPAIGPSGRSRLRLAALEHPGRDDVGVSRLARLDAVRLLLDRVHRADPGVKLDHSSASHIAQIAIATRGVPLHVELAAAAAAAEGPSNLADALLRVNERSPPGAIDLTSREAGRPPSPRSVGAALIHRSASLLRPADQRVLRALGVFRGGFWPDAAAEVADADPPSLARLWAAALVSRRIDGRYGMHEQIRQLTEIALDAAGEGEAVRAAHARHFIRVMSDVGVTDASVTDVGVTIEGTDGERLSIETLLIANHLGGDAAGVVADAANIRAALRHRAGLSSAPG